MRKSDIENPKSGFESPESRERFPSISFFEKILKKKVQKNFSSLWADFRLFFLLQQGKSGHLNVGFSFERDDRSH